MAGFAAGDLHHDIADALTRIAGLARMKQDGRKYTLPVGGKPVAAISDEFLRRRTSEEILASGLSSGCGDEALAFYDLLRKKGYAVRFLDAAKLSVGSLLTRAEGHTGVTVQEPNSSRWILVDPTNRKIVSEDWDTASKIYAGPAGRFWIGFFGPYESYAWRSYKDLKAFYARTLRKVPSSVLDEELVRISYSSSPSLANPRYKAFVDKYAAAYEELGVQPRREANVIFSDFPSGRYGGECRRIGPAEFDCSVGRDAAMDLLWFYYVEDFVAGHIAEPVHPLKR
jgi:hypothetical protein